MKSYHEITDSIDLPRITRNVERFKHRMAIENPHFDARSPSFAGLKWNSFYDEIGQRMVLELQAKVASKKFAVKTVRFPDGAWEACKDALQQSRWMMYQFVRSWLKNHPVRYVEVTMEANAYHPDVAIPDYATFVDIATKIKVSGRYE